MKTELPALGDPGANGVAFVDDAGRAAALEAAEALGLAVATIDLAGSDKAEMLARIAEALRFPPYFGHNWDALDECLGDLPWLQAPGALIVLELDAATSPRDVEVLLAIARDAADRWRDAGTPFHVLVTGHGATSGA